MTLNNAEFADLLADSYLKLVGGRLVPEGLRGADAAEWLYEAPFGLLAHDTADDPRFVYANLTAQRRFGYHWDEFVGLPSRLSAGTEDREDRRVFMESVLQNGYADNYRGRRAAKDGRQFWIEDGTVWNLIAPDGSPAGQAALIRHFTEPVTGRP